MVHSTTRKRKLVDCLTSDNLSISYDYIMDIRRIISKQVCNQYQEEEYVYPSQLHQNTFTIAVIDNLDHNFTFSTATSSYNGATIPFFQHAVTPLQCASFRTDTANKKENKKLELPNSYIEIRPIPAYKPELPPSNQMAPKVSFTYIREGRKRWLKRLSNLPETLSERINFSSFDW